MDTAYWPGLKTVFHHCLRARTSEITEATAMIMMAGQTPHTNRIAIEKAVDMTTPCGSCPRPWTTGSSSRKIASAAVMTNAGASAIPGAASMRQLEYAMSGQPRATQRYHVVLDIDAPRSENWLRVITRALPRVATLLATDESALTR